MFDGKMKALTFSYDDGVTQDIRLIEMFNKYGLKSTFNINSELLGLAGGFGEGKSFINHTRNKKQEIKYIYDGHEVAAHTLTHPYLPGIEDDAEIIRQVEQDRLKLSELVGYEVCGMAYPGGAPNCNDRVAELIKNNTGIRYARAYETTKSFEPHPDLYQCEMTLYHHGEWEKLFDMGKAFLELRTDTPKVFSIWGHSYEFDVYPERWEMFDEFCKMMSGKGDIFYGTNIEIFG